MPTSSADDKRYYVLTLKGDLGPFDRTTLSEKLREGTVRATDQVRNAFGRVQGTVAEALELRRERASGATHRAPTPPHGLPRAAPARAVAGIHRRRPPLLAIFGALLAVAAVVAVVAISMRGASSAPAILHTPPAPMAPKAMPPRPVRSAAPPLTIVKAVYGALPAGPSTDVTQVVTAAVKNGGLSIRADNSVFGDPIYGKPKQLQVVYRWNGEERIKMVEEESVLTISDQGR